VYAAGLDLAVSRDNSALAIIGKDSHGRLALRRLRVWRPPAPGRKMDLQAIEDSVIADLAEFKVKMCAVDPSQAQHMVQRIARAGGRIEVRYQGAKTLREQACELQTAFRDRTLAIPDDAMLRRELLRIRLVETAHGSIRLVAERAKDGTGHADSCTAISLALAVAAPIRGGRLGPLVAACDSSHDDRVWAMQQKLAAADARVAASLTAVDRLRRLGEKPLHLIEGPDTTRHNFSIDRLL
jgi:phage terminase large subunit-like protein